ncbi:MAG: UDP-glucose 4-epimerase, partial [Thermicanus sp.]|nr:UDP-glucose 4-epimerase [Thermicanus sp.]
TGHSTSVNQLIGAFEEILGYKVEKEYLPPREGDIRDSLFHIDKAVMELAWSPKISLTEGLRRTLSS